MSIEETKVFTGLVECMGTVRAVRSAGPGVRLSIEAPFADLVDLSANTLPTIGSHSGVNLGDSVAISGCCLTVVAREGKVLDFEAGPETLAKTNLGERVVGDRVNLERSMSAQARFGGHLVQGHVDGTGSLLSREKDVEWETLWFDAGPMADYLVPKGSVTVDGVSLTIAGLREKAFSVALIPHTLAVTTLGELTIDARVNLEVDIIGKYVRHYLLRMTPRQD